MSHRAHRNLFWVLVVTLIALHLYDFRGAVPGLLWGVVPWDLAYHLFWMLAALGVVVYLTEIVWQDDG